MTYLLRCSLTGLALWPAALAAQAQTVTVSSFTPARNSNAVARPAPVQVALSEPVGTGSLVVHSTQRGGKLAGTTSSSGKVLSFTPAQAFQPGEALSVTMPTSVTGILGTALTQPQVYQLTTDVTPSGGIFDATTSVAVGGTAPSVLPSAIAMADVDGDGDLDLLVSSGFGYTTSPGKFNVFTNNGSGVFGGGAVVAVSSSATFGIVAGDLDGDGDLDMLTGGTATSDLVSVRLNDGLGNFGSTYSFPAAAGAQGALPIALADLDGDGDLDLTAVHYPGPGLEVCLNKTGTVTATQPGSGAAPLALTPNPGRQTALTGAAPNQPVQVLDAVGRVMLATTTTAAGTSQLVLPAELAPGVYVVRVGGQALRLALE